jgi:dienelactone hydrolase
MSDEPRPGGFPIYASGQTDSKRAVIVVQEAFGVNDHIRSVADRLSDEGFLAVAPQLFHREGSPEVPYDAFCRRSHVGGVVLLGSGALRESGEVRQVTSSPCPH